MDEDEVIERWVGKTDAAMRREIEQHLGRDIGVEWEAFAERYVAAFAAELRPVDGVTGAVDAIQAAGYATCVASSGSHDKIRRNLELTGLRDRFDERIYSGEDVAHGKPAPDLFLEAAAAMGAPPDRTAVIEDSRHGVVAARAADMWVFAYAGGVTPGSALAGERTIVFRDMRELPALLG
jgi:HAD superfamily hydrolase (TIGR01509 family)